MRGALLAVGGLAALVACGEGPPGEGGPGAGGIGPPGPPREPAVAFADVAREAGIDFTHNNGAFGEKWLPETMGSGCAWVDYDGDDDPDALLLSGRDFPGHPSGRRQTLGLYRNDAGRFTDVTVEAGLDRPLYAMGVTYGDYDADGDPDLYVTALGPNRLYRNDGGRFTDVGADAGVADPGFGSSATWLDHDRDGDLDLFALNYVPWSPETDVFCSLDGTNKSYCTPEVYPGAASLLYRNDGGRFIDVAAEAGIRDASGKGLGVVALDFDGDGWEDLFVANDTQPNFLFRNRGDGTFREEGMMAGVAFDEAGNARGAMGVDAADYDRSGRPSLAVGNFSNEMIALYRNEGNGLFIDAAPTSAVGGQSLLTLAFGTFFLDFDLDGWEDLFVANGHVESDVQRVQEQVSYAQPPHLFRNLGDGRFTDVALEDDTLRRPMVARGAATADFDGDGDLDILVNVNGGQARLFRNDSTGTGEGIRLRLVGGAGSNPDGYGARIALTAGGQTRHAWSRAASSYGSQSEAWITFGLGAAPVADEIVVSWPSGAVSRRIAVPAGSSLVIPEAD